MNIVIIFILILLLLFNNVSSQITASFKLVDDTYSQDSYCSTKHFVNITSIGMGLYSFFLEDSQLVPNLNQIIEGLVSNSVGSTFYYSFYISGDIYFDDPTTTLRAKDTTYHNFQTISILNYECESLPTLQIPNIVKLNRPIKPEMYFKVYVSNLKKRIKSISQTNQLESNPFYLEFDSSEPYYIGFKLTLIYYTLSPPIYEMDTSKPTISYSCTLDSGYTFVLTLETPIKSYSDASLQFVNQYPPTSYNTFSNWDINKLAFLNGSNINQVDLFLFNHVGEYSIGYDRNQYYGLISGNSTSGQYLSLSSYFKPNRDQPSLSSPSEFFIYFNKTPYTTFSTSNPPLFANISIASSQKTYLSFQTSRFLLFLTYPDNFKIFLKIGDCNYFTPSYPYGIVSILNFQSSYALLYVTNQYIKDPIFTLETDITESTSTPFIKTLDGFPPVLLDFQLYYPRDGDGNYAVLTIHVQDAESGFSYLYYGGNYVSIADIVSGDKFDGVYEKLIYVTFDTTCKFSDISGNIVPCSLSNSNFDYYYSSYPLKSIPKLVDYDFEITTFYFDESVYDLSDTGKLVTVYLNYSKANYDVPISFTLLDRIYGDKNININSTSIRYLMDKNLNLFKITFYLPPNLCSGTIPYLLIIHGKQFTSDYLISKFGINTILNVISNDCYELPPRVTELNYLISSPVDLNTVADSKVGWSFKVETGSNVKISYVYFHVISEFDKLGYSFTFYPNETSFSGKLEIEAFANSTRFQTFRIYNATLIDERGIRSDHIDNYKIYEFNTLQEPKYAFSISPFYQINKDLLNLQVTSGFTVENNLPTITDPSDINVSQNDFLEQIITFTFETNDDVSISKRHIPQAYFQSFTNYGDVQIIQCNTNLTSSSETNALYSAQCIAGYGFGFDNGASISIYGAVDSSLNIAGLEFAGALNCSSLFKTNKPSISTWTPLEVNSVRLTLFGRNLPRTDGYAYLYYTVGDIDNQYALSYIYKSSVLVILEIPASRNPFVVYLMNSNNQESNKILINYLDSNSSSSEELPPVQCLDNCGGPLRGECIPNIGCHCISPYSGINCMSETIKVPQPKPNSTSPDSTNEFPVSGTDIKLNTIISFVAVRELNYLGNEVNIHYLDTWNLTTISSTKFKYTSKIFKNEQYVSNITVDMEWHEQSTIVTFAKQNITLNPSSLKYYVTLDQYPFETSLNTFELVIKTLFKSSQTKNVCSSKEFALNDGNDYISMTIGKYSFEGKFIKKGVLDDDDNKIVSISNKLLDSFNTNTTSNKDSASPNQQISYVAIQIPHFKKILLDPSFSVLVNPNESNKNSANSICSDKSKLTPSQIAGIAVGSFVFIVLIIIIVLYKFSNSSRFLKFKIIFYKLFRKNIKL